MSRLRNHIILLVAASVSALLIVQYLRLLQPAQARAVRAACNGMRPSPTNPIFGDMSPTVPATDFSLQDTDGKTVSLSDYRGKIVIVNFWASWCAVCRSEKPSLESLQEDYAGDDVIVLAVASDKDWAPVRRAMLGFEVTTASEVLRRPQRYGVRDPEQLPATGEQVVVSRIDRGRAAAASGLRRLDRLVSVNGVGIESLADLDEALRGSANQLSMAIARKDATQSIEMESKSPLRILLDPPDDDGNLGALAKSYGITAVPESFVVDRDGNIRHYFINKRNWDGDVAETCLQDLVDG